MKKEGLIIIYSQSVVTKMQETDPKLEKVAQRWRNALREPIEVRRDADGRLIIKPLEN